MGVSGFYKEIATSARRAGTLLVALIARVPSMPSAYTINNRR
jgi:hypothetical protein